MNQINDEPVDYWTDVDFEDTVASALIACFETKVRKNRGAAPKDRLNEQRIALLRTEGPYLASNSRYILARTDEDALSHPFDILNDELPKRGLHAFRPSGLLSKDNPNAYLFAHYFRQVNALGKYWHRLQGGTLFEFITMAAEDSGIDGERRYFTVSKDGEVAACTQKIPNNLGYQPGKSVSIVEPSRAWLNETGFWASIALQFQADRRFCWTITAQEKTAKAHLGCMQEEIKSLLYARSLPLTSTGRKRPILHLIESHRRRLQNGIDIDVTAFLRGVQIVEIDGTLFKVNPPAARKDSLSLPSRKNYYSEAAIS